MAKKKRHQGHYCRICGEYKANEKFTGKEHARHICKECQSLPKDVQADMVRCNEVERAAFKYPMSRQDWELLERYAKKYKDKESGQFARDMLDMKRGCSDMDEDNDLPKSHDTEEIPFSELEDDIRYELEELLEANISEFMLQKDFIPEERHLQKITEWILEETQDTFRIRVVPDDDYRNIVKDTVQNLVREWEADGFEIKTYSESLVIMETERLLIRKIIRKDMDTLLSIMGKPEVMPDREHVFTKKEVRKWINRQLAGYGKDGFGYYAVILKENGILIGQAGLTKSTINGNGVVELGCILDSTYWHNGYGVEAARACLEYAFEQLGLNSVCCSINPKDEASIRVAEKLGMSLCGNHTVIYDEKEIPRLIYEARR